LRMRVAFDQRKWSGKWSIQGPREGIVVPYERSEVFVMPGHSRPKDGVATLAYVPGIHAFLRQ
jgi:hypothetical protein